MVRVPVRALPVFFEAVSVMSAGVGEEVPDSGVTVSAESLLDDGPAAVAEDLQGGRGFRHLRELDRVVLAEARYREQRIVAVSGLTDGHHHGLHLFGPERDRALAGVASVGRRGYGDRRPLFCVRPRAAILGPSSFSGRAVQATLA